MASRSPARPLRDRRVFAPTSRQAAEFDRFAIEGSGVPEPALMENAGRQAALLAQHLRPEGPVAALVGSGNNGGDALVCLRALAAWGREVAAVQVGSRPARDAVLHGWELPTVRLDGSREAAGAGARGRSAADVLRGSAVIVDGLLGTGIRGAPRAEAAAAIELANGAGVPIVALDAPSGVDGVGGTVPGAAIRAELTVAFGWPKLGALLHPARMRCGRIVAVEIGFPPRGSGRARAAGPDSPPWAELITPAWAALALPRRPPDAHKRSVGALALVAGSAMPGAAVLAARAAFRCGAGLVRLCAARESRDLVIGALPEAIFVDAADDGALAAAVRDSDAIAAGPGLGTGADAARQMETALAAREERPAVLDADALTLLAGRADWWPRLSQPNGAVAVTPHPGEMGRLVGASAAAVQRDRIGGARGLAASRGVATLLKGAPSLLADPGGRLMVSAAADTSALAVAGMGDVLTGAAGSFMGQGASPFDACGLALHVTGRAAASAALGPSLAPSDVVEAIPGALAETAAAPAPATGLPFPFVVFDQAAPR